MMDQQGSQDQPQGGTPERSPAPADDSGVPGAEPPAAEPSGAAAEPPRPAAEPSGTAAGPAPLQPGSASTAAPAFPRDAGRRILAALLLLPWILGYGSVGAWAVVFGARSAAAGSSLVDAGYTRMVTPGGVILVGSLLLAAFVTLMAASLLLIYGSRRRWAWAVVAAAAAVLTGGAVWAGVRGELHPLLWVIFFFGLVYALGLAVSALLLASRGERVLRP